MRSAPRLSTFVNPQSPVMRLDSALIRREHPAQKSAMPKAHPKVERNYWTTERIVPTISEVHGDHNPSMQETVSASVLQKRVRGAPSFGPPNTPCDVFDPGPKRSTVKRKQ